VDHARDQTAFVYTIYIKATPERVWQLLETGSTPHTS